jgi:hypothetical protein
MWRLQRRKARLTGAFTDDSDEAGQSPPVGAVKTNLSNNTNGATTTDGGAWPANAALITPVRVRGCTHHASMSPQHHP